MQTSKDREQSGLSVNSRFDYELCFYVAMQVCAHDVLEIQIMKVKPAFAVASTSGESAMGSLDRPVFPL